MTTGHMVAVLDEDLYSRLLPVFLDEADRNLGAMEAALRALARAPDATACAAFARAAHTLKGNAAMLGLRELAQLGQSLECWASEPAPLATGSLASVAASCARLRDMLRAMMGDVGTPGAA